MSRGAAGRGAGNVYLILGEEEWRRTDALRRLTGELLPETERAMALDVVDAPETPIPEIVARCETLPFFGSRRVVVLTRVDALTPQQGDALAPYFESRPPSSTVILVAEKLDARRRLSAVLRRAARLIACGPLDPPELLRWVRAQAAAAGKTITPEGAEVLILLVGSRLRELQAEIGKLAAYVGARPAITEADVRDATCRVAEATIFELMDAVGQRQPDRALRLLNRVLIEEAPVKVLFMIGDQLRMLLKTRALSERTGGRRPSPDAIRETLGNRAFLYDRYRSQARAFAGVDAERLLGRLLDADTEIKTGGAPPALALQTLIVGLCL